MIRFAVLGCGRIGRMHARNIHAHPRAELAAVYDIAAEAAEATAAELGVKVVGSVEAVLADPDIEAVLIASSTDTHVDLLTRAAKAGKAILCEKPIDLDIGRVEACWREIGPLQPFVMLGFNRRFDPSFKALRDRLLAGEIGRLEQVVITSRDPAPAPAEYLKGSGGLFRDMTIHDFDMARWLLGEEPISVYAAASVLTDPKIGELGDVDSASVVLKTASGRLAQISNSRRATYGYDQRIEVHGSKGMVSAENLRATTVEVANGDGYRREPLLNFFMTRYTQAYANEIAAFLAAVQAKKPMNPSGADGLQALLLADAATLSAKEGRVVTLG